jgi:hypothetical protein
VIHAFGDVKGISGTTPNETARFFLADPEGVATTTLSGSWADKLPVFSAWWDWEGVSPAWYTKIKGVKYPKPQHRWNLPTRIPKDRLAAAHIPYHFEICEGGIVQWQPFYAKTSHAQGMNSRAAAFMLHWDRLIGPPIPMLDDLRRLLEWSKKEHGILEVIGHDASNIRQGIKPKGCPGFPF